MDLLVALAIVAILASISIPLYTHHLSKSRRNQAKVTLLHLASRLEEYHSLQHSYAGATVNDMHVNLKPLANYYKFKIAHANTEEFTVAAIPINSQAKEDESCGTLTLNELGQQTANGTDNTDGCW